MLLPLISFLLGMVLISYRILVEIDSPTLMTFPLALRSKKHSSMTGSVLIFLGLALGLFGFLGYFPEQELRIIRIICFSAGFLLIKVHRIDEFIARKTIRIYQLFKLKSRLAFDNFSRIVKYCLKPKYQLIRKLILIGIVSLVAALGLKDPSSAIVFLTCTLTLIIFFLKSSISSIAHKFIQSFPSQQKSSLSYFLLDKIGAFLFVSGFILIVVWFKKVDLYNNHFYDTNSHFLYILDHCIRVLFTIYTILIYLSVGKIILNSLFYIFKTKIELNFADKIISYFSIGIGALQIIVFFLGLLNGYNLFFIGLIISPLLIISYHPFKEIVNKTFERITNFNESDNSFTSIGKIWLGSLVAILMLVIFIYKVIFPAGNGDSGDYFTHYFPYYMQVIEQGNLQPNDVWYHFYSSKGAGLLFYSFLLADPLANQLTSFSVFIGSVIILYSIISKLSHSTHSIWPLFAIAIYLTGFVYTNETIFHFGFWASFHKEHILTAGLLACIFWLSLKTEEFQNNQRWLWVIASSIPLASTYILRPQLAPLLIIFFGCLTLIALFRHQWQRFWTTVVLGAFSTFTLLSILAFNYALTGMAEVTPFRVFWKLADQARLSEWISPYLLVLLEIGSSKDLGGINLPDMDIYQLLSLVSVILRLDRFQALWFALPVAIAIIFILRPSQVKTNVNPIDADHIGLNNQQGFQVFTETLGAFWIAAIVVMILVIKQPVSLYRLYVFFSFFTTLTFIALYLVLIKNLRNTRLIKNSIAFSMVLISVINLTQTTNGFTNEQIGHSLSFSIGRSNMAQAYESQNAMWPAAIESRKLVGLDARIWASQITGKYCMIPRCNLETFFSYSMEKHWHEIMFENSSKAKSLLQNQGLNFFLIDTESPFFDILPYSDLFLPNNILDNFGLLWTDGTSYLLTWPSSDTKPLTEKFLKQYVSSLMKARAYADFIGMYKYLKSVYKDNKDMPYPLEIDESLPEVRGWQ